MPPISRLALLCVTALLVATCGGAAGSATLPADVQVTVDLKDYSVSVTPGHIKAGTITFGIRNLGAMEHQVDLIKTDLAGDKLPVDGGTAKAKEDGLVKQVKGIAAGRVATVSADLAPGHYVIICNVAGHYQLGMRADFTVE